MKADPDMVVLKPEGLNIGDLAFNAEKKTFDDSRALFALNMAVNEQASTDILFQSYGTAAKNPIPPTMS